MFWNDFTSLVSKHPELGDAWPCVRQWLQQWSAVPFLDIRELARICTDATPVQMAKAIELLVESGLLKQVYRIESPDGFLVSEEYTSPDQIPRRLRDRADRFFDTSEGEIIPGFQRLGGSRAG
jgi:hypothetical protein